MEGHRRGFPALAELISEFCAAMPGQPPISTGVIMVIELCQPGLLRHQLFSLAQSQQASGQLLARCLE
jgi:hypothetical protein